MRTPKLSCAPHFLLSRFALAASVLSICIVLLPRSSFAVGVNPVTVASTVPSNGDVNPYGIARVPRTTGLLVKGDILVSNFNNSANLQGTGTTIVQITPNGTVSVFAQIDSTTLPGPCPGGVGLTTALAVLRDGWVIVGSLPTTDGTSATVQAGCLLVLNNQGQVVETFYGSLINGPWDMTALDAGNTAALFVTNVLNGTIAANGAVVHEGTVVRLMLSVSQKTMPSLQSITVVGSGFPERSDPAAVVIGPTGLGLSADGRTLYVADSLSNRIASISDPLSRISSAGRGTTVTRGGNLKDPLGLTVGTDGSILSVNGANGYLVETTPGGLQIATVLLDSSGSPPGAGALFGLISVQGQGIYYVDDATNTLNLLH